ncbi:carbohydrate kinase family protein [Streptosporangiaceae bacterium NEAU-GS5]|nr:carbohydrate kinase family protein [Streptosporangiaceae bacterium NEAU-GS5]
MTYDVLVIGGTGVDTTVYVPELPLPYRDTYHVPPVVDRIGNTGSGVALGCTALGLRVKLLDFAGDDPAGRLIRDHLAKAGVAAEWAPCAAGTTRSVLLVAPDGRRLSLHDPRAEPGQRLPDDLYLPLLPRARHVHVSIVDWARHLYAHFGDLFTSTDLHDWDGASDYHRDFAYGADLVFLSDTGLADRAAVMRDILVNGRAGVVACTSGAAGAYLLTSGDRTPRHFPAADLPGSVADSNGAGDAFVSGFLYGLLNDEPLERCMRFGAVAGAHAVTSEGTHEAPIDEATLLGR